MKRTAPLLLLVALAISACGNDAGEGDANAVAANTVAAADNGSTPSPTAPAGATRPAPASPSASAAQPAGASAMPLQPLSEEDLISSTQTGCTCTFNRGDTSYLQTVGDELMVRTASGRQVCRVTDAQFQSLGEPDGEVMCKGVRVSIRERGPKTLDIEADSSDGPATLSATQSGSNSTLDGTWGCAC